MKIKPYINKLSNSKEYKEFHGKYSDSFMMAGFFILDFETGKNLHQIDYYVPTERKIAAFTLDRGVIMQMLDMIDSKIVPEKLDMEVNIDLDAIHGILEDEMKNRSITEEVKKIIAILQAINGKKIWNLNCVLSGMSILKVHLDDESKTVLKMEKSSILDYVKKMPAMLPQKADNGELGKIMGQDSEKDIKEKIKSIQSIEKELKKEEEKYAEELKKKGKKKDKSTTEKQTKKE
ncbi:hypothetical protein J4229_01340 [Candidatus Pacearchaeota archaeon]|nr:hypothetical protein [Candidatus Pacearchaeota archaeon]